MCAPPRSTLVLRPFRLAAPEVPAAPEALSNWGLVWYSRVDFDRILKTRWPQWAAAMNQKLILPARQTHLRLCGAVALLRPARPRDLEDALDEVLGDEVLRLAPNLAGSLPPLLLATRAAARDRAVEPDPVRALALLTHLSGRTCDPCGSPLLSEALQKGHALDFWTPEAAHV
jgi:hypothetical protein